MRRRYVKLSKKKSGDGVNDRTQREDWLFEKFSFLHQHIMHRPGKGIVSLKSKAKEPHVPSQSSTSTCIQMREEVMVMEDDDIIPCDASTPTTPHSHSTVPPPRKKVCVAPLYDRVEASQHLRDKVQQLIDEEENRPTSEKALWGQWMASVATNIHDDLWEEFQDWSYNGLRRFKGKSLCISEVKASQPSTSRPIVGQILEPGTQQKTTTSSQQQPQTSNEQQPSTFDLQHYQDLSLATPKRQQIQQQPVSTFSWDTCLPLGPQTTLVTPPVTVHTPGGSFNMDMSLGTLTQQILEDADVQEL